MTTNILSPNWRGERAAPIDPDAVKFDVAEAKVFADCEGCMFIGQSTAVCRRACDIAVAAGGIDCDYPLPNGRSLVYVLRRVNPRQLELNVNTTEENHECI